MITRDNTNDIDAGDVLDFIKYASRSDRRTKSIDDELKLEHIIKVFEKYTSEEIRGLLDRE